MGFQHIVFAALLAQAGSVFVEKTHFDDDVRFVFVAGLEGTGHHFFQALFSQMKTKDFVVADHEMMRLIYEGGSNPLGVNVMGDEDKLELQQRMLKPSKDAKEAEGLISDASGERLRERRRKFTDLLKSTAKTEPHPKMVMLNTRKEPHMIGFMSYPNYGGSNKPQHHPDLVDLAQLAEKAGVDLRILVIQRDARDVLTSTTIHRGFSDTSFGSAYLADTAAVLSTQLRLLDPKFFACTEQRLLMGLVGTEAELEHRWKSEIGPFLHPGLDTDDVLATVTAMERGGGDSHALGREHKGSGVNVFVEHMERYFQTINETCHA